MLTTDRPDLFEDFSEIGWLLPTGKLLPGEQAIREFHSKSLTLSALTPSVGDGGEGREGYPATASAPGRTSSSARSPGAIGRTGSPPP